MRTCIGVCVRVCVCLVPYTLTYAYAAGKAKSQLHISSSIAFKLIFRDRVSHWSWRLLFWLDCLARNSSGSTCLHSLSLGFIGSVPHVIACFYRELGICTLFLPLEPSSQLPLTWVTFLTLLRLHPLWNPSFPPGTLLSYPSVLWVFSEKQFTFGSQTLSVCLKIIEVLKTITYITINIYNSD